MISYTSDEIEKARLEALESMGGEDDDGVEYKGYDETKYLPGSFGYHEAFDRTYVQMEQLEAVLDHIAIMLDPEAYRLAHEAHTNLFNLYQYLGMQHMPDVSES
jgi:hypothetical protein